VVAVKERNQQPGPATGPNLPERFGVLDQLEKNHDAMQAKIHQRKKRFLILEDEIRVMSIQMLVCEIRIREKAEALGDKKAKFETRAELRLRQHQEMEALKQTQAVSDPPTYSSSSNMKPVRLFSCFVYSHLRTVFIM